MKIRTKWLKDFFRNTYKVASAYITRLSSWSSMEPNDGTGLKEFFIAPERARNVLTGMQYVNDSDTANFLGQMWERYLRSKWTERVSKNRSNKGQAANFNNLYQFVSEQADLATDAVYSEKELSSHELYLVLQKAPPGWMCWVSKKPQVDRKDFDLQTKVYALVVIVLNTSPSLARVEDHARYAIRNTQRPFTITTGDQKRWGRKEGSSQHEKPPKGKGKSESMCAPPFPVWRRLVTFQALWVQPLYASTKRIIQITRYACALFLIVSVDDM